MNLKRVGLIDRLEKSGEDYIWYVGQLTDEEIHTPPAPKEWSIHQVVAHMRDTQQRVFVYRAQRLVKEEHPKVENFDQEVWHRDHYSPDEPLKKIVSEYRIAHRKFIRILRDSEDPDWKNWAVHPDFGKISLEWLALHNYQHNLGHIAQIVALCEQALLKKLNPK
jgi:hypothetical protein